MAVSLVFDAAQVVFQDGRAVNPIERSFNECSERLRFQVPWTTFRDTVREALGDAPEHEADDRLCLEDLYVCIACRAGNDQAWRLFDRTYRGYLIRLATRYAGGSDKAEDLITDLYHDLVTRRERPGKLVHYKGYASLSTWLAVIVRRMAMDRGRMSERRNERLRRLRNERVATRPKRDPETLVAGAQAQELVRTLFEEAFSLLEGRHALVLSLLYRDGMTLREAGKVMGLDFSTVSRRAKAARKVLESALVRLGRERFSLEEKSIAALILDGAAGASFQRASTP